MLHTLPAQKVQVQVEYCLSGIRTCIDDQPVAGFLNTLLLRQPIRG